MNVLILTAIALLGLIVLAQLIVCNRFAGQVDALRIIASAEQVSDIAGSKDVPDIMRLFAVRNGAIVGGPTSILAHQRAEMRLGPKQDFFAIIATQLSGTRRPSFVWDAWGKLAGFVPIHVVDSYVAGAGLLEARLTGSILVARGTGPESDKGEIMRFLSELAWNPDAILNADGLTWRQIDQNTVEVSAPSAGGVATVRHLFNDAGDIEGIKANDRPYAVDGGYVPARWIGRFSDYQQFGRYRLPRHGEVAWVLPEGEFVYWRGDVTAFAALP